MGKLRGRKREGKRYVLVMNHCWTIKGERQMSYQKILGMKVDEKSGNQQRAG